MLPEPLLIENYLCSKYKFEGILLSFSISSLSIRIFSASSPIYAESFLDCCCYSGGKKSAFDDYLPTTWFLSFA
jgi:hypothetical protein